jgi:hypothetical protein
MRTFHLLNLVLLILLFASACAPEEDSLVLNKEYLHVADVLQYCQGTCTGELDWENNAILTMGHVIDIENDSTRMDYYEQSRFFLLDVRNGMFLEVRVPEERDAVFEILFSVGKQDRVYIDGIAASIIVNEGNDCQKGVVIELSKAENIQVNL